MLCTDYVGCDTPRESAGHLGAEVSPDAAEAKHVPPAVAVDLVDSCTGGQRPSAGLRCGDLKLTLIAQVMDGDCAVAITITGVVGCHGVLSFMQVELHGALPLRRCPAWVVVGRVPASVGT